MSVMNRMFYLSKVLGSIESLLIDSRSLNILTKLRANEPLTIEDMNDSSMEALCHPSNGSKIAAFIAVEAMKTGDEWEGLHICGSIWFPFAQWSFNEL